jgi:biopolymer transport protein ExbD
VNFREGLSDWEDSFQIAPLIDIVFLLLTFFIVTGALAAQEKETGIELPKTTSAVDRQRGKLDVRVNVTRQGDILINQQRYTVEHLRAVLAELRRSARSVPVSVIIRADGKALHEDVVRVLDACAAARLKNVSFVSINASRKTVE